MSESKTQCPLCHNFENHQAGCRIGALELELNEAKRKLNAIELVRGTHDCGCEVCGMGSAVCPASASSYALAIVEAKDQLTTAQQEIAALKEQLK